MEKCEFEKRLIKASQQAVALASEVILEQLGTAYQYIIFPNQSSDINPLIDDQETYPNDSLPLNQHLGPFEVAGVVSYLWRSGKVPEWINIGVDDTDGNKTYIVLRCCGRYSSLETCRWEGVRNTSDSVKEIAPFSLRYPIFPKGWKIMENGIPDLPKLDFIHRHMN